MARESNKVNETEEKIKSLEDRLEQAENALKDVLDALKWAESNIDLKIMPECEHYETKF